MSGELRILPADGRWETLGRGTLSEPRGISPTWNVRGPDTLGFDIDLDPFRTTFELREFTPVEWIPDGDDPLWAGFVYDAPRTKQGLSVSCRGWQYHLDDDAHPSVYLHSTLGELRDTRTYPCSPTHLKVFVAAPQVVTDGGFVTLLFPKGTPLDAFNCVGVTLDQGPDPEGWATHFQLEGVEIGAGLTGNMQMFVRQHDAMETLVITGQQDVDFNDAIASSTGLPNIWDGFVFFPRDPSQPLPPKDTLVGQGGVHSPTGQNPPRRYWSIFIIRAGASVAEMGSDEGFQIRRFDLYRDAAYRHSFLHFSGLPIVESNLRAHHIFTEEAKRPPLLSRDLSRITTVTFNIPAFGAIREEATPGQLMTRADSYHRYRWGVDAQRRVYFEPQPAFPDLTVNTRDPGVDYKDTSHNSGAEVYNKVIVTGSSGSGEPLRVVRFSSSLPDGDLIVPANITSPNPSMDVDKAGWVKTATTPIDVTQLFQDTVTYYSPPGSLLLQWTAGSGQRSEVAHRLTGEFLAGLTYTARVYMQTNIASIVPATLFTAWMRLGNFQVTSPDYREEDFTQRNLVIPAGSTVASTFTPFDVTWTPVRDSATVDFQFGWFVGPVPAPGTVMKVWLDDLLILQGSSSMPDRRGFLRSKTLEVGAPTDTVAMADLGDLWLKQHLRPPFKGSLDITAPVVSETTTGRRLNPREVASRAGELIRLADVIDPYTGSKGRDAIMASGNAAGRMSASVALDDDRASFEALMARMAVVQGR